MCFKYPCVGCLMWHVGGVNLTNLDCSGQNMLLRMSDIEVKTYGCIDLGLGGGVEVEEIVYTLRRDFACLQHTAYRVWGVEKVENKVNVASCNNRTGPCMLMLRVSVFYMYGVGLEADRCTND